MKRWKTAAAIALALTLIAPAGAWAQDDDDYDAGSYDYEPEEVPRFGLGVAGGLVDPGGSTEPYYTANLRIRLGSRGEGYTDRREQGIYAVLEPEVGYWERNGDSDLLAGVNLLGVVPFRRVNYFFGVGAGVHFLDTEVVRGAELVDESDQRLGLNAQFGIDVLLGDNVALFGAGRFDLVEGATDDLQDKIYVGLRFLF
ncbi:MAG TPA: hypothetical protein VHQ65_14840 [Thermoanaerobaculia bacterium]|nr:hypothetical protein [Thermoanaerobaculia bacterium]